VQPAPFGTPLAKKASTTGRSTSAMRRLRRRALTPSEAKCKPCRTGAGMAIPEGTGTFSMLSPSSWGLFDARFTIRVLN
jgi:hypothetical protein